MDWFQTLTGFKEESPDQVRANLHVKGQVLTSKINDKSWHCGTLTTPSLAALRQVAQSYVTSTNDKEILLGEVSRSSNPNDINHSGKFRFTKIKADVRDLLNDKNNTGALFQVASQFNLLEMVSPNVTPEQGVGIYEKDHTQGPACAIACGAGTIYRNYFADVNGHQGQLKYNQINCLSELAIAFSNGHPNSVHTERPAESGIVEVERVKNGLYMRNGYALPSAAVLGNISRQVNSANEGRLDYFRGLLRIGVHWGTEVTTGSESHRVTQALCSALPVAYSEHSAELWEPFARLVLEAAYEATLWVGVLNFEKTGCRRVYLTSLGGGAFGNRQEWIKDALERALKIFEEVGIEVCLVEYG